MLHSVNFRVSMPMLPKCYNRYLIIYVGLVNAILSFIGASNVFLIIMELSR